MPANDPTAERVERGGLSHKMEGGTVPAYWKVKAEQAEAENAMRRGVYCEFHGNEPLTQECPDCKADALRAENARLREALRDVLACMEQAAPDAFKNGVTDPTGMNDEGEYRTAEVVGRARAALAPTNEPTEGSDDADQS